MNYQPRYNFLIFSFLLGGLIPLGLQVISLASMPNVLAVIGDVLRTLSLSGTLGNVVALSVVGLLALLPIIYQIHRERTGKHISADWLMPVLSIQICFFFFYLVNPTLISHTTGLPTSGIYFYLSLSTLIGTLITYMILRILLNLQHIERTKLLLTFRRLLSFGAALLIFLYTFSAVSALLSEIKIVQEANTYSTSSTIIMLCFLMILNLIPSLLSGLILLWASDMVDVLEGDPFCVESTNLCKQIAVRCSHIAVFSLLISLFSNLLQLVQFKNLHDINISIEFPFMSLLLSVALLVLCRYLQQGKILQDDNESII